jgi:hypothetical protein
MIIVDIVSENEELLYPHASWKNKFKDASINKPLDYFLRKFTIWCQCPKKLASFKLLDVNIFEGEWDENGLRKESLKFCKM